MDLLSESIRGLADQWSHSIHPKLKSSITPATLNCLNPTFSPPISVCDFPLSDKEQLIPSLVSADNNLVRFSQQKLADGKFISERMDWLVRVQNSAFSSESAIQFCADLVKKLTDKRDREQYEQQRLFHIVSAILDGIAASVYADGKMTPETSVTVYGSLLAEMVHQCKETLPWSSLEPNLFSNFLLRILENPTLVKRTYPLIDFFICLVSKNAKDEKLLNFFLSPLKSRYDLLEQWINACEDPLETFAKMRPVFVYLKKVPDPPSFTKNDATFTFCKRIADVLFSAKTYQKLVENGSAEVVKSDRFGYSTISACGKDINTCDFNNKKWTFGECINVLVELGGERVHSLTVEYCSKLLTYLIESITDDYLKIVAGAADVSEKQLKSIIYLIFFCVNIFEYISSLCHSHFAYYLEEDNESEEKSTAALYASSSSKSEVTVVTSSQQERRLCTFSTTAQAFVEQHWYCCYTCNMYDGEGVCSVCAVNCHRGHDLAYSKRSPFFCDCGAKGCAALKKVQYPCSSGAEGVEKVAFETDKQAADRGFKKASALPLSFSPQSRQKIESLLSSLLLKLMNLKQLNLFATALAAGLDMRSYSTFVQRKSKAYKQLEDKVEFKNCTRDIMEHWVTHDRMNSYFEGLKVLSKAMVTLEFDDSSLLAVAKDSSKIALLNMGITVCPSAADNMDLLRVELDFDNHKISSLAACQDLLGVCFNSHFRVLRLNKLGDIIQERKVPLTNMGTNNKVVKIAFLPSKTPSVAIATQQFVRIYDPCDQNLSARSEFVLPLGNISDVTFVADSQEKIRIFVLSSHGHVYVESLDKADVVFNEGAYFMTNTIQLPSAKNAVSLHYSSTYRFLFISLQDVTYALQLGAGEESQNVHTIPVDCVLDKWSELDGIISAVSAPDRNVLHFIYFMDGVFHVQSIKLTSAVSASCMLMSLDRVSHIEVIIDDDHNVHLYKRNHKYLPDFWIEDLECSVQELKPRLLENSSAKNRETEQARADLVTTFDSCTLLEKVEFSSKALSLRYDVTELTKRLNSKSMSAVSVQDTEFDITVRNLDWNYVICALSVEVSSEERPDYVTFLGQKISLQTDRKRTFDIVLSRNKTLECRNQVKLVFTSKTVPAQVLSIKVFGKTKRDFGFPSVAYNVEQKITAPEYMIASFLQFYCDVAQGFSLKQECDLIAELAEKFVCPGYHHNNLRLTSERALGLFSSSRNGFFSIKDNAIMSGLAKLRGSNVEYHTLNACSSKLRWILKKRTSTVHQLIKTHFSDVKSFLEIFALGAKSYPSVSESSMECFLLTSFLYMGARHVISGTALQGVADLIFSENILAAHRCKCFVAELTSAFCSINFQMNKAIFGAGSSTRILEPSSSNSDGTYFFSPLMVSKLASTLSENELSKVEEDVLGDRISSAVKAFTQESDWIARLLIELTKRLCSNKYDGKRCVAGAQTILFLIGHFSAEQLPALAKYLIDEINFDTDASFLNPSTLDKQLLLLQVISVILAQCTSRRPQSPDRLPEGDGSIQSTAKSAVELLNTEKEAAALADVLCAEEDDSATDELGDSTSEGAVFNVDTSAQSDLDGGSKNHRDVSGTSSDATPRLRLAKYIASELVSAGAIDYCLCILVKFTLCGSSEPGDDVPFSPISPELLPNLAPIFDKRVVKVDVENIFKWRLELLAETSLKLPYQLKVALGDELVLGDDWEISLCQCIIGDKTLIGDKPQCRRLARKLLHLMCSSDLTLYRKVRDAYKIRGMVTHIKILVPHGCFNVEYLKLCKVKDVLERISELSRKQRSVWQGVCIAEMPWLLKLGTVVPDCISDTVLNLILLALRASSDDCQDSVCCELANSIFNKQKSFVLLKRLINRYLMSENEERRFALHALLRSILQLASRTYQVMLLNHLYTEVWPFAQFLGSRAAQLVDLLATYATRFYTKEEVLKVYHDVIGVIGKSLDVLQTSNDNILCQKLSGIFGTADMSVLNENPCFICAYQPEPLVSLKLSAIKLDSRFTTSAQMIKLMSQFEVVSVVNRLTDIKRSKMIKRIKLYYCNKNLESAVELKNRPDLWEEAADVEVAPMESEITLALPIPVPTWNIILDIVEFHESGVSSMSGTPEMVHCPRCSAAVPPNPGICPNCSENVFQCVKCRAINYDERDPFLCSACGFCKYARLESSIVCRPLPSVQRIEDDEGRKTMQTEMKDLLSDIEAERCEIAILRSVIESCAYSLEQEMRPAVLLQHSSSHSFEKFIAGLNLDEADGPVINTLYRAAETHHSALIGMLVHLIAIKNELYRYNVRNGDEKLCDAPAAFELYSTTSKCPTCTQALAIHCVTLLQSLCNERAIMEELINGAFIFDRLVVTSSMGGMVANAVHEFIWNLAEVSEEATAKMCELARRGDLPSYLLAKSIIQGNFRFWEQKLRCLVRTAVFGGGDGDIDLHAITVLRKLCSPNDYCNAEGREKSQDSTSSIHILDNELVFDNAPTLSPVSDTPAGDDDSTSAGSSCATLPELTAEETVEMDLVDEQDLVIPNSFQKSLSKAASECTIDSFSPALLSSDRFPTRSWLNGSFSWVRYTELLAADSAQSLGTSAFDYLNKCCTGESSNENVIRNWLKRCIFSPFATTRYATCQLLIAMCYFANKDGNYELGSPVDCAHVVHILLLWLRDLEKIDCNRLGEFFFLLKTLVSVTEIRSKLISAPFLLHMEISKMFLVACMKDRITELNGSAADLSFGRLSYYLIQLLNCLFKNDESGWTLLSTSSEQLLQYFLRSASMLCCIVVNQTRYINLVASELEILIMRIAMKKPVLVLNRLLQRITVHKKNLRVQAHLLHLVQNIVQPVLEKEEDFSIHIEKDPLQEDYLQGRMMGNPYKSSDPGMGPLMRDIKKKICRDCELIALLDDENSMELLVDQKIISLDLLVVDVYEKMWRKQHPDQPLTVIYRMRGLLGDATEPFVKTIGDASSKNLEESMQILRLAKALGNAKGGLAAMTATLDDIELTGNGKALLKELQLLLAQCVKVESNRDVLIECGGIRRLLHVFEVIQRNEVKDQFLNTLALQYLELANVLLIHMLAKDQCTTSVDGATFEQMSWLLELSMSTKSELTEPLWEAVTSIVPNLCVGNTESMDALIETFRTCCNWTEIDSCAGNLKQLESKTKKLDTLCTITSSIHASASGKLLKDKLIEAGLIRSTCDYLLTNHPPLFNVSVEAPQWVQFLTRPSLKYVLKLLAGMAKNHESAQEAIGATLLPVLHRLEQVSSNQHIGTLAENVMEELMQNKKVAKQILEVREETKSKKKQMAMAMRQKQLSKLGMKLDESGQVKVMSRRVPQVPQAAVTDAIGCCCICREHLSTTEKIMTVYAFASRHCLEAVMAGRQFSFSTVSQLNFVHLDCHTTAIRMASSRDEWASASLHNANTRCNVMLPVWSGRVKDSDMEMAIQRLSNDFISAVGCETVSANTVLVDISLIIDKFVNFRSFSELSHGGGRESNIQYLCILLLLVFYLRKCSPTAVLAAPQSYSHAVCTCLVTHTTAEWNAARGEFLQRIHSEVSSLFNEAKPELFAWMLVNSFQNDILNCGTESRAEYIQKNFLSVMEKCSQFVNRFDASVSQAGDFEAFKDAVGQDTALALNQWQFQ